MLVFSSYILCEPGVSDQFNDWSIIDHSSSYPKYQRIICVLNYYYYFVWSFIQYLDFDNLPETNFTCAGKVIGGYYADLETSCQMFHVCTIGQLDEPMDIKFLCLNGTVFDQETRVCERVEEVDCPNSEKFYNLNLQLYGNTMLPEHEGNNCALRITCDDDWYNIFCIIL